MLINYKTMNKQTLLMLVVSLLCVLPLSAQNYGGVGIAIKAVSLGNKSMELCSHTRPAVFPYGSESLNKYIARQLPLQSMQAELGENISTAEVVMQFSIDSRGRVTEVQNVSASDDRIASDLTNVFRGMPRWIPAIQKSQPQQSTHRYIVHIVLNDKQYGKPYISCKPSPMGLMARL